MLSMKQIAVLEDRGLDTEILVKYGVDGCPDRGPEWIRIPYFLDGKLENWKYRTIWGDKRFGQEPGAKKLFWNVDCISDKTLKEMPLICTEGELDALAAIQCGFSRVVSVPEGAPSAEIGEQLTTKYDFIATAAGLADVKEIILCTDSDGPGNNLLNDLALRLGRARCKWVRYPGRCKDLNDVLKQFGPAMVVSVIGHASWLKVPGLARMSELPPLEEAQVYHVGIPGLEPHYRIRTGDVTVIVGTPGHGKTACINAISGHMALQHGWPVAVASFEQRPQVDHRRNLRTFHASRRFTEMSDAEIRAADRWIEDKFIFMAPNVEDEVNLEWMLERMEAAAIQAGSKLITIDPVNEMDHIRPRDMTETDYLGFLLKSMKRLAFRLGVHIIMAVHPAKMQRGKDGTYPIPSMYDAAGSSHYYNKPDQGLIVHRLDKVKTLIRVAKSKYHDILGTPDDVHVSFNPSTGRYEAYDAEDRQSSFYGQ